MLNLEQVERYQDYQRARGVPVPPGAPVCAYPIAGLHFLPRGLVMPCCTNTSQVLGVYPRDSVAQIWNGEPVRRLREALAGHDLSLGCQRCERQFNIGDFAGFSGGGADPYIESLDRAAPEDPGIQRQLRPLELIRPGSPRTLGFEIHNTCNLECVMCSGDRSSRILTRRMGDAPFPNPYDTTFLDQLDPFLPQVRFAFFAGGEPFLINLYYDLWERIAARYPTMKVMILTNGTIFNDRVRRLLERLDVLLQVSIDSIHKSTYESIRVGASFEKVMDNCRRLQEIARGKGTKLVWRHCVMRKNWIEVPDILRYCNENDIRLEFNQLDLPLGMSIHTLPLREIESIVDYWRRAVPPTPETETQEFNAGMFRDLMQRIEAFARPDTRSKTVDLLHGLTERSDNSGRSALTLAAEVEEVPFPSMVLRYMMDQIVVENERQRGEGAGLPEGAEETLAGLRERIRAHILEGRDVGALGVYVQVAVRAHVAFWGTPEGHSLEVFERARVFPHLIVQHPARLRILDDLLATHPATVYTILSSRDAAGLKAYLAANYGAA